MRDDFLVGFHLSIAEGLEGAIAAAEALETTALQIFSHNARSWRLSPLAPERAQRFRERLRRSPLKYAAIHAIYLINLASPKPDVWRKSIAALRAELERAALLGVPHVATHLGAHVGRGPSWGVERVVQALAEVFRDLDATGVALLLENSAGEGTELGARLAELGAVLDHVSNPLRSRLGICIDTCHALAAGYEIRTLEGLEAMLEEVERTAGLERLRLVHLNDSAFPLGSRRDRHTHIGQGHIGLAGFAAILHHPALRAKPFILETPKERPDDDARNLRTVRALWERAGSGA